MKIYEMVENCKWALQTAKQNKGENFLTGHIEDETDQKFAFIIGIIIPKLLLSYNEGRNGDAIEIPPHFDIKEFEKTLEIFDLYIDCKAEEGNTYYIYHC